MPGIVNGQATYQQGDLGANGVDPSQLKQAYLSGDYAGFNSLAAKAGLSETGARNVISNFGYSDPSSVINEMKARGVTFAQSGSPNENTGWNTNATGPGSGSPVPTPAPTPAPSSVPGTTTGANGAQILGDPTKWNVTSDQTVQGRIASIISNPNDPLQVQAKEAADEQSNSRGIVNSSIALGAAQGAMYQAAMPIAQSDAATFAKAAGYNADQQNQFATQNANFENQFGLADKNNAEQTYLGNLNAQTQRYSTDTSAATQKFTAQLNADTQTKIATLDNASKLQVQQLQDQNQVLLNTSSQAAQAFNQAVVSANNIQTNPNLDANSKTQAIAEIWQSVNAQLATLSKLNGLDLTSSLNFAGQPGFDSSGKWVGFPSSTPAPTPAPIINSANGV